ncbi:MAG: SgcJ/EcaC family oxidoreductase [Gemmatimonadales bacterium]
MRTTIVAVSLLLSTSAPALAQDHSKDEAAIRAQVVAYEAAINGRNRPALAELFTPEADFVYFSGPKVVGRDSIVARTSAAFAEWPSTMRFTLEVSSVRFVRPDVALVETKAGFSEGEMRSNRGTALLERRGGKWLWTALRVYPAEARKTE